jgi:hypothetical protein
MPSLPFCWTLTLLLAAWLSLSATAGRLSEDERVEFWHEHHTWPPNWNEETEGYRQVMEQREAEIMSLTGADERWENWMQFVQGRLVRKFTPLGFKIMRTPAAIQAKLKAAIERAVEHFEDLPFEAGVADSIYAFAPPKFVELGNLKWEVSRDLKHLHEEWAGGIKLKATSVYGVRLYQNGSTIVMHYDKPQTHVISSIVHIAHQYDDDHEPWHIQIEGHDGELYSVALEEGQMMFYESAKCLHGRMKMLKGKYYGSVFIHYQPVDKAVWNVTIEDVINAVPPFWREGITEEHGSRWAGQAITTDSWAVENAPPRVVVEDLPPANEGVGEADEDFYESLENLESNLAVFRDQHEQAAHLHHNAQDRDQELNEVHMPGGAEL